MFTNWELIDTLIYICVCVYGMANVYFDRDVEVKIPDSLFDYIDRKYMKKYICCKCGSKLIDFRNLLHHKKNGKYICNDCWRII